jgi:hypothetical protein
VAYRRSPSRRHWREISACESARRTREEMTKNNLLPPSRNYSRFIPFVAFCHRSHYVKKIPIPKSSQRYLGKRNRVHLSRFPLTRISVRVPAVV